MVEYRINVINPEIGTVETHIFTKEDFTKALKKNSFIRGNTQQTFAALLFLMHEVIKRMTKDNLKSIGDYIYKTHGDYLPTIDDVRDWLNIYGADFLVVDMSVNENLYYCSWCLNPLFTVVSNIT